MKVLVAGNSGLVGSAVERYLTTSGSFVVYGANRNDVDFLKEEPTLEFLTECAPDWIVVCAAKVGGIYANSNDPTGFLLENLKIQQNIISGAFNAGIDKLIFLGSSCIYPKYSSQPIKERELLSGYLEPSNESYALAKICGIKLCESFNRQFGTDYRCLMPTNLYGPNDNFNFDEGHVIPSLISRMSLAKRQNSEFFEIWGSGQALRDFLHVDDLARAIATVISIDKQTYWKRVDSFCSHVNVGSGSEISIFDLALLLAKLIGYPGIIKTGDVALEGTPRKLLDIELIKALGWRPEINLQDGLKSVVESFLSGSESRL